MTADEARDRMSDALEGTLSAEERVAFDAALAADAELADEYRSFCEVVRGTSSLAAVEATPEILPSVQAKLRRRSRGRFYRDRFAEAGPRAGLVLMGLTAAVLAMVAWYFANSLTLAG